MMRLAPTSDLWWKNAVVYCLDVETFHHDFDGLIDHIDHVADLGATCIWLMPFYPTPNQDDGYDISDYLGVDPRLGDLGDVPEAIRHATDRGLRVLADLVCNHTSIQHPWFQVALTDGPGTPARELFWFRPGRGRTGEEPPTDWVGEFGGQTWTRSKNPDGQPGEWFLHLFTAQQPDLNWDHPDVRREHGDVLRFWFDRGVAGIRIDSAALLVKDATLPEAGTDREGRQHPFTDRDELHDIYRGWRQVADSYPGGRVLVGELWLSDPVRFAQYLRPDELHTAFNFDFMTSPWDAGRLRQSINTTLAAHAPVGAPATRARPAR